jgi:ribosome-associated heat shock protein Hsp15
MGVVEQVRIEKWLWAALLFKARSAASEAVLGGRVHLNGERVKPSKAVRVGDTIELTIGRVRRTLTVTALGERRGREGRSHDVRGNAGVTLRARAVQT